MKKLIIILSLLLIPVTANAWCKEVKASKEAHCMQGRAEPCEMGNNWYFHRWEQYEPYIKQGKSCRACATVATKFWMQKNKDEGWQFGRCGSGPVYEPVLPEPEPESIQTPVEPIQEPIPEPEDPKTGLMSEIIRIMNLLQELMARLIGLIV